MVGCASRAKCSSDLCGDKDLSWPCPFRFRHRPVVIHSLLNAEDSSNKRIFSHQFDRKRHHRGCKGNNQGCYTIWFVLLNHYNLETSTSFPLASFFPCEKEVMYVS